MAEAHQRCIAGRDQLRGDSLGGRRDQEAKRIAKDRSLKLRREIWSCCALAKLSFQVCLFAITARIQHHSEWDSWRKEGGPRWSTRRWPANSGRTWSGRRQRCTRDVPGP